LSLVRVEEGLGSNGSIVVNNSRGDYDANGAIYIGKPGVLPLPDVTFDGRIKILDSTTSGGGDLNSTITVRGCHATNDDLDICICGNNNGSVTIQQGTCSSVTWSCVSGCP
jgi:hypothetical protein